MKKNILILIFLSISLSLASTNLESLDSDRSLIVHKTPTCGCCKKWMKHLESLDFETSPEDHQNLLPIKEKFGIKPEYRSCHTAVSKEGYVFDRDELAEELDEMNKGGAFDDIELDSVAMQSLFSQGGKKESCDLRRECS